MCGIVGWANLGAGEPVAVDALARMLAMIRHRGPDAFGVYVDGGVGLGNARLSIIDLEGGRQPIRNEDGSIWVVDNGEVYNYLELRAELIARGHRFYTHSDTEVIVHLYEEYGPAFVERLNGPFAIALWDRRGRELLLARDRLGIRPLFYTLSRGRLLFASEIKALLAAPGVAAEIDPVALAQVLTFWTTLSPRTAFRGIVSLPPGHTLRLHEGNTALSRYWSLDFSEKPTGQSTDDAAQELLALLVDATRLRLRSDVPVGAYLSGGLDSSTIAALVRTQAGSRLCTFGIGFTEAAFDETRHQERMSACLGTEHRAMRCTAADLGTAFPAVVWHCETPMLRTAPAPMYLLSRLVHDAGYRVVLTGEGADEILGGYDIYKETAIRRFWARCPEARWRALLLRRLYPYVAALTSESDPYLQGFFGRGLTDTADPYYSHRLRWNNTARCARFLSADLRTDLAGYDPLAELDAALPADFARWSSLARAQYLEIAIFMSEYLLSSQGDRMTMAHGVEGRYPFLDHRVVEFCGRLPSRFKLNGLQEKWLLRRAVASLLPEEIVQRRKQPYRAPIAPVFLGPGAPDYVGEVLAPDALVSVGLFAPDGIRRLTAKYERMGALSEVDQMALVAVLTTQILHRSFVSNLRLEPAVRGDELMVCQPIGAPPTAAPDRRSAGGEFVPALATGE